MIFQNDTNLDIAGKVVLVTGASGGIGRHLVQAFIDAGAQEVIAAGRGPASSFDKRARPLALDVTSIEAVASAAKDFAGRVDILVNNSGVNRGRRIIDADIDAARHEMDVNYFGLLNMVTAFAPAMKHRKSGVIINIVSVLAHVNQPLMASYCASKAAALSLTQALRAEMTPFGVQVCAVLPPVVDTAMSAHAPGPKLSPEDVAHAVVQAVRDGVDDVYPGSASELLAALQRDAKAVERMMAARVFAN